MQFTWHYNVVSCAYILCHFFLCLNLPFPRCLQDWAAPQTSVPQFWLCSCERPRNGCCSWWVLHILLYSCGVWGFQQQFLLWFVLWFLLKAVAVKLFQVILRIWGYVNGNEHVKTVPNSVSADEVVITRTALAAWLQLLPLLLSVHDSLTSKEPFWLLVYTINIQMKNIAQVQAGKVPQNCCNECSNDNKFLLSPRWVHG